jgi:hypothetical protein
MRLRKDSRTALTEQKYNNNNNCGFRFVITDRRYDANKTYDLARCTSLFLPGDFLHPNRSEEINQLQAKLSALHILSTIWKKMKKIQSETRVIADAMTLTRLTIT